MQAQIRKEPSTNPHTISMQALDDSDVPVFLRKDYPQKKDWNEPKPSTTSTLTPVPIQEEPKADNGNHEDYGLDELSVDELKRHQEEVDRKIREKQAIEKRDVINQIVEVAHTYDVTVEELVEALGGIKLKRKGVKAKPKYRNPTTGTMWSGRGKEPSWIKGKDRTGYMIK